MSIIKRKISLINNCLLSFDYSKLFVDLKTEEFANYAKNLFMNEQIDLFSKEINNTFLYIYLLKKNLFNEIAYKSVVVTEEDWKKTPTLLLLKYPEDGDWDILLLYAFAFPQII